AARDLHQARLFALSDGLEHEGVKLDALTGAEIAKLVLEQLIIRRCSVEGPKSRAESDLDHDAARGVALEVGHRDPDGDLLAPEHLVRVDLLFDLEAGLALRHIRLVALRSWGRARLARGLLVLGRCPRHQSARADTEDP